MKHYRDVNILNTQNNTNIECTDYLYYKHKKCSNLNNNFANCTSL